MSKPKSASYTIRLQAALVDTATTILQAQTGENVNASAVIRAALHHYVASHPHTSLPHEESEPLMTTKNDTTNYTIYMHPATFRALTVLLNDATPPRNRNAMLVRGLRALAFLVVHGPSRDYIAMPAHELAECEKAYREIFEELES